MEKPKGEIGEILKQSINTEEAISDCVNFEFDIKIVSFKGKFCKSGILDVTASILGIEIVNDNIDLSKGQWCHKVSIGIEEVQYCFYAKNSCLYTKGYVDGWFHDKQSWDEKIVCV